MTKLRSSRCTASTCTGTRCKHRRKHVNCELCPTHYRIFLQRCENKIALVEPVLRQMRHPDVVET